MKIYGSTTQQLNGGSRLKSQMSNHLSVVKNTKSAEYETFLQKVRILKSHAKYWKCIDLVI